MNYSTVRLSRAEAMTRILNEIAKFPSFTEEELEALLFTLVGEDKKENYIVTLNNVNKQKDKE